MRGVEDIIIGLGSWMKLGIETVSVILVSVGAVVACYQLLRRLLSPSPGGRIYHRTRLIFSRFLCLALEFQLAADIIGTAVAPSWDQLGKLGAIAAIRTFLNYFLMRELEEEEQKQKVEPTNV